MMMFMRFCELDLSSLKMGNSCPSLNLVTDVNSKKEIVLTFCEQVKAKTCIGNVERKLGVNLMRWTSPGEVMPLIGRK
jgi:hypothetical protein